MRRLAAITVTFAVLLLAVPPAKPDTLEFMEFSAPRSTKRPIKWPSRRIAVALSSSLNSPGQNFALGADVIGAARRAMSRWAAVANITFVESSAAAQSISGTSGDGISLITIADTRENNAIFDHPEMTGRTRVFYDPDSGVISEADICINPHPALSDGTPVKFSTDGTPGSYDLESTFTHEIGHLLGLDHSWVMASTMQARQGLNGVYGLPAFTGRTLSEEDRERMRSLYGPDDGRGSIAGKAVGGYAGAQLWAENTLTGRVVADTVVSQDGTYRIDALPPGQYRLLIEQRGGPTDGSASVARNDGSAPESERLMSIAEVANHVVVTANALSSLGSNSVAPQAAPQFLNPRLLGINGELSNIALPLEAGKRFRIYLGGEDVDQVPGTAISINSPFFKVDSASLTREQFSTSFPVVSIEVTVAANAPFGDYSIRLQSNSGEVAFLAGGITIDPGVNSTAANPVDDPRFFVSQHYRDFLGRDADRDGLDYWTDQLQQCGSDANCVHLRRLGISAAFFADGEFQETGSFVYGLYKTLGRRPTFAEFNDDRSLVARAVDDIRSRRRALASDFVSRPEFFKKYPADMSAEQFVDALEAENSQTSAPGASFERADLISLYDGTQAGRATIVSRLISDPAFVRAEYSRAYVLMQYFAYLRRDPDEAGYNFWLNVLQNKPARDAEAFRGVACAFLSSAEYQLRFGMVITHSSSECR